MKYERKYEIGDKVKLIKNIFESFLQGEIGDVIGCDKDADIYLDNQTYDIKFSDDRILSLLKKHIGLFAVPYHEPKELKIRAHQEKVGDDVEIINFSSFKRSELPEKYLFDWPFVVMENFSNVLTVVDHYFYMIIKPGDIVSYNEFKRIHEICEKSASKLRKLNKQKGTEFAF